MLRVIYDPEGGYRGMELRAGYANFVHLKENFEATQKNVYPMESITIPPGQTSWLLCSGQGHRERALLELEGNKST